MIFPCLGCSCRLLLSMCPDLFYVCYLYYLRGFPEIPLCACSTTSIVSLLIVDRASTVKSYPFVPHVHPSSDPSRSIDPFFLSCLFSDNVSRSRPYGYMCETLEPVRKKRIFNSRRIPLLSYCAGQIWLFTLPI